MNKKKVIEKLFNKFFRVATADEEWEIWHNRKLTEIEKTKKFNEPVKEISDATEIKYYSWLSREILTSIEKQPKNILEVGGGSGALSLSLSKKTGANCTVVDNSRISLDYASLVFREHHGNFVKGNGINLPFGKESYDFVHSIGLIEHYEDSIIIRMISEMKRVLKENGYIYLAVPNYFSPDLITLWLKYGKGSERYMPISSLERYVLSEGLQIIKTGHCGFTFSDRIGRILPETLEKKIGELGLGFLNYVICQKR